MYTSNDERVFELQVLDGREYVTAYTGNLRDLEINFASLVGKIRRLVIPGKHPARPKYCRPRGYRGPSMETNQTIRAHIDWAMAKGLRSIAVYDNGRQYPHLDTLKFRRVPVADFLGDAPMDESEERMAA